MGWGGLSPPPLLEGEMPKAEGVVVPLLEGKVGMGWQSPPPLAGQSLFPNRPNEASRLADSRDFTFLIAITQSKIKIPRLPESAKRRDAQIE